MTKEEVKDFLVEQGFKPIQNRELDAILTLSKSVLLINVTVKDENLKGQIDGKKVLKFPNDRYELILRVKDKVISTKTGFNLDSLESDIEAFKELDASL
jgi:hypothetical protein